MPSESLSKMDKSNASSSSSGSSNSKAISESAPALAGVSEASKTSEASAASSPSAPIPSVPPDPTQLLIASLEKMMDSKFGKLESRLETIESRLKGLSPLSHLSHLSHPSSAPPQSSLLQKEEDSCSVIPISSSPEKKDKDLLLKLTANRRLRAPDEFVHEFLSSIKTEIVDSLSSFDNKISEFSLVLEKQDETIGSVHKKIENSLPENEIKNLIPKIMQLQKNLDCLLAGESETNALIDNVIPTMNKLQKDVEEFIFSQKRESTKLNEDLFPKVHKCLGEIYDKTKDLKGDLIDQTVQILDKSSKIAKSADDVKLKISRLEEKILRHSPSDSHQRSRSKGDQSATRSSTSSSSSRRKQSDDHHRGVKKAVAVIESDTDSETDKANNKIATTHGLSEDHRAQKEIRAQLGSVLRGIEHLEKEIRKFDIVELVEEKVIPNIYSIRKSVDQLVPSINPNSSPGSSSSSKKLESPMRNNYYVKLADDRKNSRKNRPIVELAESEDVSRSRSPKGSVSSRSRGDFQAANNKKRIERSLSPDSEDGEIQMMERRIEKISVAVNEIQDKMDSWLKYSKRTLSKSDENTGILMDKLSKTSSMVNAINNKLDSLPQSLEKSFYEMRYRNSSALNAITTTTTASSSTNKGVALHPSDEENNDALEVMSSGKSNADVESRLNEFSLSFERHFFELSNKIDSSIGKSSTYKAADEVITTTLLHRLDDLISRTKKNDSYIKSNNENTAKVFSLLKKIESGEKVILTEIQKNLSSLSREGSLSDISKYLEEVSPRLNDIYVKILPALDDIKKESDRTEFLRREDSEHIQKILDLVEDIKEEKIPEQQVLPSGSGNAPDANINQIYNALNDLKIAFNSKDSNSSKLLNELKADNAKLFGKINDVIKSSKSSEKSSLKICSFVEELRKNNVTDAKTISQMNTVLQGLKASGPAYEKLIMNSMKDLKEDLNKKVSDLPTVEYLEPLIKSKEVDKDFFTGQFSSMKKLIEELIDKVNLDESHNIQQLLDSTQTIILEMFSKELKQTEKNILAIGTTLESQISSHKASYEKQFSELDEGIKSKFDKVESYLSEQFREIHEALFSNKGAVLNKRNAKRGSESSAGNTDLFAKLLEIENKMLSEKEFKCFMEELNKYQKLSSEILNSVEDLKILTSSTPTAIHDIVPKIDKIHSIILELPNEYLTALAATEENLCLNLDAKIKDQHQLTLQEVFDKFDQMDSRMAVIKKYAKHGPGMIKPLPTGGSTSAQSTTSQEDCVSECNINSLSRQISDLKAQLLEVLQGFKDIKITVESFQISFTPRADEILGVSKQILQEQAKGLVVEDQLEALCNTLLQPIQKLSCGEDIIISNNNVSLLHSLEEKQVQCLDILSDMWSSHSRGLIRSPPMVAEKEPSFSATVKTAVEAAVVSSSRVSEHSSSDLQSVDKRTESIQRLVSYFKKVKDLEMDIISKCNTSIELQAQLNTHLSTVVPNVDRVRALLENVHLPNSESKSLSSLDELCDDIMEQLRRIVDLGRSASLPRSKSIDELKEFVQLSVSVMQDLCKDDENEQSPPTNSINSDEFHPGRESKKKRVKISSDNTISLREPLSTSENHVNNLVNSSNSRKPPPRKRKAGPRSAISGYVDQGPFNINDQSLQPVVKLVKNIDDSMSLSSNNSISNYNKKSSEPLGDPLNPTTLNNTAPSSSEKIAIPNSTSVVPNNTDTTGKESTSSLPSSKRFCMRQDKKGGQQDS